MGTLLDMPVDPEAQSAQRRRDAMEIVKDLLARWARGEATSDDQLIDLHRHLMPEFGEELRSARLLRQNMLIAHKLGPAVDAPPIRILSEEELNAPIETTLKTRTDAVDAADSEPEVRPQIPGCQILDLIDRGAHAAVYRAVHEATGRTVAVKVVAAGLLRDSRQRARFEREAEILAALRHPHVVQILDRGRTGEDDFYLLMEFIDGSELDRWWKLDVPLGPAGTRTLLELFVKVCQAVEAAHARAIVHRDLKPSNIRVDRHGEPRVFDFGLARPIYAAAYSPGNAAAARAVTVNGQFLGSVPWASPEQASGNSDRVDARSDVYSLGVMLHQGLTDHFPYGVDGPLNEVLDNIANAPAVPPSRRRHSRTFGPKGALDAIVLKALAKEPVQRYASAGALGDDLRRLLSGENVVARRPGRKNRRLTFLSLVIAFALPAAFYVTSGRNQVPPMVAELPSITNSVGMRLVRIPAGSFRMGSGFEEVGRRASEAPRMQAVGVFYIGTQEVTQDQYQRVMGSPAPNQRWRSPDLPVHNVSWSDAMSFCKRLSANEGQAYRLPREAEWEYACRAGSNSPFFGEIDLKELGWYNGNSGGRLHPPAGKWANIWGLYDMHGNVSEWCDDPYAAEVHAPESARQPRVTRGGSALDPAKYCRAASRFGHLPSSRAEDLGFRVVLEPAD